jgi:hypothetical protein
MSRKEIIALWRHVARLREQKGDLAGAAQARRNATTYEGLSRAATLNSIQHCFWCPHRGKGMY